MCYYFKNQIFFKKSATLLYCFFDIDLEKTNLAIFEDFSEIFYGLKLKAGLSSDKIVGGGMLRFWNVLVLVLVLNFESFFCD